MPKNPVKHQCTFCKRIIDVRDQYDMPIYDPNTGFAICKDCVREINRYLDEHDASVSSEERTTFRKELGDVLEKTRPHLIKEYLDTYIINQDRAKKILAVAVYNHYKRMKYGYEKKEDEGTEIEKSNVIMLGPSGCGKTALLSHLSKLLDVPFAVTDASSLTEAGFVGADVEVAVRNLYYAADKDVEKAEHGIIYLDEFDKIARKSGANNSITADPGHEGVQQALLKMLEGSVVEFTARGQRKHPEAPTIKVDTKNILFIVGGAFVGIEKIIAKRLKKGNVAMGFGAEVRGKDLEKEYDALIHQVTPEDLMEYGIIPEIIGRLPVICTLETLDEDALLRILTEPINAPVRQYQQLLAMDGVELVFTEDALRAVAKKAIERKTGARSLRGIIEEVMLDVMFDIPRETAPRRVTVTKECITEGAAPTVENAAAG
ncbi:MULTISPECIES: ATP-dependent Clp protease ATP-binding subunit ClpX [Selenomonas]|uniref:ATP-dependent Clp protease ATP-binding subunit ClpX n=1 Tax=Selenomonas TaxID=970 RepID=UPI0001E097DC|nr:MULTISPECIES: ATP-dependent Clp protease ATP-binding subunit ClpX [Selenomonas]AME03520.1 ATP-dependent Clp protease ATP-binding subunit ClpX [Selenomonas sp. oral taxon 136]EFM22849.1 ATP-dependent Clp protease, ATP-binding subunit ClpX [Selenomonas sp. oral taxon 149 str. 67H29BP]MBF1687603.1 ATP-dependent Clp protease ATP-binding subunit ClpX [Selenomonas sp.]MBF1692424.1 ATP-dependent Clp protease ATP-binding subunit ClpX [Selenomonas sp.]MBF1694569.1 ATP-dependent Clp protease ATP-bind